MVQQIANNKKSKSWELFLLSQSPTTRKELGNALGSTLPEKFVREMHRFKERNSVVTNYSIHGITQAHCCKRCLKAHALKTANELGLDSNIIHYINRALPGESGHDGYYLNQEQVFRL